MRSQKLGEEGPSEGDDRTRVAVIQFLIKTNREELLSWEIRGSLWVIELPRLPLATENGRQLG